MVKKIETIEINDAFYSLNQNKRWFIIIFK